MKTINLTLGRSTILSFYEKPVKVVAGNSNYFNIEYIGNDLTIQPLANVETNLFVYTQSKSKYGFHLKVGSSMAYDDIVYVRWKSPYLLQTSSPLKEPEKPAQKRIKASTLKFGHTEILVHQFLRLTGTKGYLIDFEIKNKGVQKVILKQYDIFVSRNNERLKGQKLVFERDTLPIHGTCRGRLFLSLEKNEDFSFYVAHLKSQQRVIISKQYL